MPQTTLNRRVVAKRKAGRRATTKVLLETLEERSLLSTGLVAAYSFNEGSGATVHDLSGNGNTGTIVGATWVTDGKYGDVLSFNGTNEYVTISNSSSLDLTSGMTLEAWVDPASVSGQKAVLIKEQSTGSGLAYALDGSNASSDPSGSVVLSGGVSDNAANSSSLPLNAWSFLAATYNGSSLDFYVNGVLEKTTSASGTITSSSWRAPDRRLFGRWPVFPGSD